MWIKYNKSQPYLHYDDIVRITHSSALVWKIPWTEEPGGLQSTGLRRLRDFPFNFHFPLSCIGEGNGNPLQCSCLENPRGAAVYGVAQSRTRLKRLSSSSSSSRWASRGVRWLGILLRVAMADPWLHRSVKLQVYPSSHSSSLPGGTEVSWSDTFH